MMRRFHATLSIYIRRHIFHFLTRIEFEHARIELAFGAKNGHTFFTVTPTSVFVASPEALDNLVKVNRLAQFVGRVIHVSEMALFCALCLLIIDHHRNSLSEKEEIVPRHNAFVCVKYLEVVIYFL